MKKSLIALLVFGCTVMAEDPIWNMQINTNGTATWTTTLVGGFNFDLGDLAIKDGESFTLSVKQTATSWANGYGTGVISTGDPYDANRENDQFRFYVGKTGTDNAKVIMDVNGWEYDSSKDRLDGYTNNAPQDPSAEAPLTLGFVFQFVNGDDAANSNDYFVLSSAPGADVVFAKTDDNIVRSFNFSHLQNTSSQAALPGDVVTTISITKEYLVPEPATATFSLLALAGFAARRRRK